MLVTGYPREKGKQIEIIKGNFKTKVCDQMSEYPLEVSGASGGNGIEGKLFICGGLDSTFKRHSDCYFLKDGEWIESESLQTVRISHAASNVGEKIWITGGIGSSGTLASTEIIEKDGKVISGPKLPEGRFGHCQVTHEKTTFIIGMYILC